MTNTKAAPPRTPLTTCSVEGCGEPRKTYPTSPPRPLCARHESERIIGLQRRMVPDPERPGELVAWNTLKQRKWRAAKKAQAEVTA